MLSPDATIIVTHQVTSADLTVSLYPSSTLHIWICCNPYPPQDVSSRDFERLLAYMYHGEVIMDIIIIIMLVIINMINIKIRWVCLKASCWVWSRQPRVSGFEVSLRTESTLTAGDDCDADNDADGDVNDDGDEEVVNLNSRCWGDSYLLAGFNPGKNWQVYGIVLMFFCSLLVVEQESQILVCWLYDSWSASASVNVSDIVYLHISVSVWLMLREDERERESGEEGRGVKREAEKELPWVRLGSWWLLWGWFGP